MSAVEHSRGARAAVALFWAGALAPFLTATARATDPAPAYRSSVAALSPEMRTRMTGVSWHVGCPVALEDLRVVTVTFWGFDGQTHEGPLIVRRRYGDLVVRVFGKLFGAHFPIEKMRVIDEYGGDDDRAVFDNNTSAFNCRKVLATKSTHWSQHAYGAAIDINPLQNPYVYPDGHALDPDAQRYTDRTRRDAGMIFADGVVVRAFAAEGWGWGGRFSTAKDYQHFSSNSR